MRQESDGRPVGDGSRRTRRLFPQQFWLLIAGTFLYYLGYDLGYPFETVYLHGSLGISVTAVGLIIGLSLLAGLPVQMLGGALADRLGRRALLLLGIAVSVALFEGLARAGALWQVVALIAVEAAFGWSMVFTANNAMVADLSPLPQRSEAFALSRVAVNAGMTAGPLVAALLLAAGLAYRGVFAIGGALCALFLVLALAAIKESRPAGRRDPAEAPGPAAGYRSVLGDRRFLALCGVALLPTYAYGQFFTTLPVELHQHVGIGSASWGLLAALYAGCAALVQYPLARRTRDREKLGLLSLASAGIGLGLAGAALAPPGIVTVAGVLLFSLATLLFLPVAPALISEMAALPLRGRYMGVWTVVWIGGTALGPTFGGLALDRLGGRGAYLLVLAAGLLGALLFAVLRGSRLDPGRPRDGHA